MRDDPYKDPYQNMNSTNNSNWFSKRGESRNSQPAKYYTPQGEKVKHSLPPM